MQMMPLIIAYLDPADRVAGFSRRSLTIGIATSFASQVSLIVAGLGVDDDRVGEQDHDDEGLMRASLVPARYGVSGPTLTILWFNRGAWRLLGRRERCPDAEPRWDMHDVAPKARTC